MACVLCQKSDSPKVIWGICKKCCVEIRTALNQHKEGQWSKLYDACVVCKQTTRKIHAFGKCVRCSQIAYRRKKREIEAATRREKIRLKLLENKYDSKDNRCISCEKLFEKAEEKIDTSFSGQTTVFYHRACWMKEME